MGAEPIGAEPVGAVPGKREVPRAVTAVPGVAAVPGEIPGAELGAPEGVKADPGTKDEPEMVPEGTVGETAVPGGAIPETGGDAAGP